MQKGDVLDMTLQLICKVRVAASPSRWPLQILMFGPTAGDLDSEKADMCIGRCQVWSLLPKHGAVIAA